MNSKKDKKIVKTKLQRIAEDLDISLSTVSRALNNKPGVNKETQERIIEYAGTLDKRLSNNILQSVGIVDTYSRHKVDSYYVSYLLEGIDERLHAFNYNAMLVHSDQIDQQWHTYGECHVLESQKGLIWMEPLFDEDYLTLVQNHKIPCVVINNLKEDISIDSVKSNNYAASLKGIEFLANQGHTNIGFIGGYLNLTNHKDRYSGYIDGLKKAGIDKVDSWIIDDIQSWNDDGGFEGMTRILSMRERPTVVMLASDLLAAGCYKAVQEQNLRIPEDISIISFDDAPFAKFLRPGLTTFRQPLLSMGIEAANRLISLIMGKQKDEIQSKLIDCPLIVRDSIAKL